MEVSKKELRMLVVLDAVQRLQTQKVDEIDFKKIKEAVGINEKFSPFSQAVIDSVSEKMLTKKKLNYVTAIYALTAKGKNFIVTRRAHLNGVDLVELYRPKAFNSENMRGPKQRDYGANAMGAIAGLTDLVNDNERMRMLLLSLRSQIDNVLTPETETETEKEE